MISEEIVITREEFRQTFSQLFDAETCEPTGPRSNDQNMAETFILASIDVAGLNTQLDRQFKIRLSHEEPADTSHVGQLPDIVRHKVNAPTRAAPAIVREFGKIAA